MLKKKLVSILVCPVCKGRLKYRPLRKQLVCEHDELVFPVRNGVPVLTVQDAMKLSGKTG